MSQQGMEPAKRRKTLIIGFGSIILLLMIPAIFFWIASGNRSQKPPVRESSAVLSEVFKYLSVKLPGGNQGLLFIDSGWKLGVIRANNSPERLHLYYFSVPSHLKFRLDMEVRRQQMGWIGQFAKLPKFEKAQTGTLKEFISSRSNLAKSSWDKSGCLEGSRYIFVKGRTALPETEFSFFSIQKTNAQKMQEIMFAKTGSASLEDFVLLAQKSKLRCFNSIDGLL